MPLTVFRRIAGQRGQTAAEYMGVLLLVCVVIAAVSGTGVAGSVAASIKREVACIATGCDPHAGGSGAPAAGGGGHAFTTAFRRAGTGSAPVGASLKFKLNGQQPPAKPKHKGSGTGTTVIGGGGSGSGSGSGSGTTVIGGGKGGGKGSGGTGTTVIGGGKGSGSRGGTGTTVIGGGKGGGSRGGTGTTVIGG